MAKYRIMTFDGGGVRGALISTLLQRLVGEFPDLLENVDLLAGTSTGSMVTLSLAYGKTPDDLVEIYSQANMESIFGKPYLNMTRPKYDNTNLIALMEKTLSSNPRLGDLTKYRVVIAAFRLDDPEEKNWEPYFFHNYPDSKHLDELAIDVGLYSSAAPTFFPAHKNYIDGGVMANNPSTAALAIASGHDADNKDISLLSFGTGKNPTIVNADATNWGIVQWMINPFHQPHEALLNILMDGVVEADVYTSRQLLGARYYRLNPLLPQQTALDDWRQVPSLVSIAQEFDLEPVKDWIQQYWL